MDDRWFRLGDHRRYPIPKEGSAMEQFGFVDDNDMCSLYLVERNPVDRTKPVEMIRVHVHASDCVAGVNVDAASWVGFVQLFSHDYLEQVARTWVAPNGEWQLTIEKSDDGTFLITSGIDSLHSLHRWKINLAFTMSAARFRHTAAGVIEFVGTAV